MSLQFSDEQNTYKRTKNQSRSVNNVHLFLRISASVYAPQAKPDTE